MDKQFSFLDFSVVIPTYNGASHQLKDVIQALQNQEHIAHLAWEIIVVDNNSKDQTANLVHEFQEHWQNKFLLYYVMETKQGAAYARSRGVQEAHGEFIGFLDDDNIPLPDWIKTAYEFGKQHPKAGVWHGKCFGLYEQEPGPFFKPLAWYLAICDRGDQENIYHWVFPAGAGLIVRRCAWLASFRLVLPGRTPTSLLGCEDLPISIFLHRAGWEIWYNPKMRIQHYIPQSRLEPSYLLALMRDVGLARYPTRYLRFSVWLWPLVFLAFFAKDTIWLIRYFVLYCYHGQFTTTHYLFALHRGLWCGPYFFLWQKMRKGDHPIQ